MMREAIVSAILGASITAVFTLFPEETKALILGRRGRNRDLIGKWNCIWKVSNDGKEIKDHILISKVAGERVLGTGKNTISGNYIISGRLSPSYLLTLTYCGVDKKSVLGGVVILELNATRDVMKGHWLQYRENREFHGGTTIWEKA
jgi:hypothetical protein